MTAPAAPVTPETKVGALLDAHPELEDVLLGLSPRFAALRNPVLRRTVARLATLAQAARIAELPVPHLVNALRAALGQEAIAFASADDAAALAPEPEWVRATPPAATLDAEAIMSRGGTPLAEATAAVRDLAPGAVLQLDAPFHPAPLIDAMTKAGHEVYARPLETPAGDASPPPAAQRPWRVSIRRARQR